MAKGWKLDRTPLPPLAAPVDRWPLRARFQGQWASRPRRGPPALLLCHPCPQPSPGCHTIPPRGLICAQQG